MTERALLLTGIGGQGIQLAARTLAVAAVSDGLQAMVFGEYGGMMRGGNSDSTVVLGTERLLTPPTVSRAWARSPCTRSTGPRSCRDCRRAASWSSTGVCSALRSGGPT